MILVDSSAWIEFLRDTGSPACEAVDALLAGGDRLATCDPVRMEVLAGARDEPHLRSLRGLLGRTELLAVRPADYDAAAALYRGCRQRGGTVRRLIDCLVAAVAIRRDVALLHADRDFDALAAHSPLVVHRP
ncbi:MAG TPA: PIN domain nuclease [Acidimicrobiales bacterium]|nr:PIN domain nuclease [Acidimicrobiales bacterium]